MYPKKVSILVIEGCTPISPVGAMEIFNKAARIHQEATGNPKPFFETELVGIKAKRVHCSEKFSIDCHTTLDQVSKTNLLLIPALDFEVEEKLERNKAAIPHLIRLYRKGAELASMCTGAFLLAKTGLLQHKSATTHWYAAATFRSMFPDIRLEDHKIIIDEGGIYTSGGATSSLHLCVYLTEKYCGKETADMTRRMLVMDNQLSNQTRFSIFAPQTQHEDEAIGKAQRIIEKGEKPTVESLALETNLSMRSFIRRFKAATGNTPVEYIQRVSVEKAKRGLESSKLSIEEIIYSLGYRDMHSFRKIFVRYTDLTPKEYRQRYGF